MLNSNYAEKFVKEGLTFDDVLLIPAGTLIFCQRKWIFPLI